MLSLGTLVARDGCVKISSSFQYHQIVHYLFERFTFNRKRKNTMDPEPALIYSTSGFCFYYIAPSLLLH